MFLYAIPIVLALTGGTYTCLRGVKVRSGSVPMRGEWRIRWACWRFIAQIRRSGREEWEDAGSAGKGELAAAGAIAKLLMPEPGPGGELPGDGMIRVTRARML